jgi:hypothetical protein
MNLFCVSAKINNIKEPNQPMSNRKITKDTLQLTTEVLENLKQLETYCRGNGNTVHANIIFAAMNDIITHTEYNAEHSMEDVRSYKTIIYPIITDMLHILSALASMKDADLKNKVIQDIAAMHMNVQSSLKNVPSLNSLHVSTTQ